MIDYNDIALNLIKKDAREQKRLQQRIRYAHEEIKNLLAHFLEIDPDLQKVILFGSLAKGAVKSLRFDIDLAIRCTDDKFFSLVATALDSDFKVDIVDLNAVDNVFRAFILKDGIILYEKC
jgi:predicted nucleotidyltransferase